MPPAAHFLLAATLAELGQIDDAKIAVEVGLSLDPHFITRRYRARAYSDNRNYLAGRHCLIERRAEA